MGRKPHNPSVTAMPCHLPCTGEAQIVAGQKAPLHRGAAPKGLRGFRSGNCCFTEKEAAAAASCLFAIYLTGVMTGLPSLSSSTVSPPELPAA